MDHAFVVDPVDLVLRDLVVPCQEAAFFEVSVLGVDPSSFSARGFVGHVVSVGGAEDAADEAASELDADVDCEDVDSDFVVGLELVLFYIAIRTVENKNIIIIVYINQILLFISVSVNK